MNARFAQSGSRTRGPFLGGLLAMCWIGVAAAQGSALDAPMQPIKKKAPAPMACPTCGEHDAGLVANGKERGGPEFPSAQDERAEDGRTGGPDSVLDVPMLDSVGANPATTLPVTP